MPTIEWTYWDVWEYASDSGARYCDVHVETLHLNIDGPVDYYTEMAVLVDDIYAAELLRNHDSELGHAEYFICMRVDR